MFRSFFDSGLHVIPVRRGEKGTYIKQYNEWSVLGIPEDKIEEWEQLDSPNYGLLFGPASGLIGLDIDIFTNLNGEPIIKDPWLVQLLNACPHSPIEWRGLKEGTRIFNWSKNLQDIFQDKSNQSITKQYPVTKELLEKFPHLTGKSFVEQGVEIRLQRCYSLIPPSIHMHTNKPYFYKGLDLLKVATHDREIIPDITNDEINKLFSLVVSPTTEIKSFSGRNNQFVQMISAARGKGKSDLDIAREIYDFDLNRNCPRLFTDSSEGYSAKDEIEAKRNALKLVGRVTQSLLNSKTFKFETIEIVEEKIEPEIPVSKLEWPDKTNSLNLIASDIEASNFVKNPNYAIGGALSLISVFAAGKWKGQDNIYPAIYSMILGNRSSGKDAVMKLGQKVLHQDEDLRRFSLLGPSDYSSEIAGFIDFAWQRYQLSFVDEGSNFIKQCANVNSSLPGVARKMTQLWSINGGYWRLSDAMRRKGVNGESIGPSLSLILGMQKSTFQDANAGVLLNSGFLARFLYFVGNDAPEMNQDFYGSDKELMTTRNYLNSWYKATPLGSHGMDLRPENQNMLKLIAPSPHLVEEPLAVTELKRNVAAYFYEEQKKDISNARQSLLSKAAEQTSRVALLHCIGRQDAGYLAKWQPLKLDKIDVEWAKYIVETTILQAHAIVEASTVSNVSQVVSVIAELSKPNLTMHLNKMHRFLARKGYALEDRVRAIDLAEKSGMLYKEKGLNGKGFRVVFI